MLLPSFSDRFCTFVKHLLNNQDEDDHDLFLEVIPTPKFSCEKSEFITSSLFIFLTIHQLILFQLNKNKCSSGFHTGSFVIPDIN